MTTKQLAINNIKNLNNLLDIMGLNTYYNYENNIMSLETKTFSAKVGNDLKVSYIGYKEDIDTWIRITSDSFLRYIHYDVIHNISKNKNIDLILVYKDEVPVGSALLFTNSDIVSIHFIRESTSIQDQEVTHQIIQEAIAFAHREEIQHVTILSPLTTISFYKTLGFQNS